MLAKKNPARVALRAPRPRVVRIDQTQLPRDDRMWVYNTFREAELRRVKMQILRTNGKRHISVRREPV